MFFYAHIGKIACLGDWVWAMPIGHGKLYIAKMLKSFIKTKVSGFTIPTLNTVKCHKLRNLPRPFDVGAVGALPWGLRGAIMLL